MMKMSEIPGGHLGAVILAGGRGTRLTGKCLRRLGDRELLLHVYDRVSVIAHEIIVSVKDPEQAARIRQRLPAAQVVVDEFESQCPLAGLLSGLRAARSTYVFATGCDMAFIEPNIIRTLFQRAYNSDGAIPIDGEFLEPLCAVYRRKTALRAARRCVESGRLSMLDMVSRLRRLVRVPVESLRELDPQLLTFQNINSDEDFDRANKIIQARQANSL